MLTRIDRLHSVLLPVALCAVLGFSLPGCNGDPESTDPAETPEAGDAADHDHDHDHGDHSEAVMSSDVEAALAELSPEDREVAEAQKVCAVAGEPLGSMGPPIKVEHEGKPVFLCCAGCKKAFEADPEKYLATLPNWQDDAETPEPGAESGEATDPDTADPSTGA